MIEGDWSSDVCSSDLGLWPERRHPLGPSRQQPHRRVQGRPGPHGQLCDGASHGCPRHRPAGRANRITIFWIDYPKVYLKTKKMTNISQVQAGFKAKSRRNPLWISRLFNAKSSCACRNRLNFRLFRYTLIEYRTQEKGDYYNGLHRPLQACREDRKSTRLNSSHPLSSRMPSSA